MYNLPQYDNLLQSFDPANSPGTAPGQAGEGTGAPSFSSMAPGTATGIGNLSPGQAAQAFGQGMFSGLPGVSLGNNIANAINQDTSPTLGQLGQIGMQGVNLALTLANPSLPGIAAKAALSGLISLAAKAQASTGVQLPTFGKSLQDFTQGLKDMTFRSFLGLKGADEEGIPDASFTPAATVAYPDFDVTFPDVTDPTAEGPSPGPSGPSDSGEPDGGPGGNSGSPTGGGDSGNPGDFYKGGLVDIGSYGRDKVPAHLTRGEYVIDADSSEKFRKILDMLNRWEPK